MKVRIIAKRTLVHTLFVITSVATGLAILFTLLVTGTLVKEILNGLRY